MSTIANKLEKEEKTFNKERVFKKEKIKLAVLKKKSNEKALTMFEEISKMTKKRRLALVRDCLKQIMGSGQNVLYWELRKLFAQTPMEAQCSVLKAFQFPTLKWHGYDDKIVQKTTANENPLDGEDVRPIAYRNLNVDPPPNDGSMVTEYGDGVKISLFRCMCEERTMVGGEEEGKEEENDGEASEVEETKDGESPNEEPKLKNKKEEKEIEIIEKEEKQVDEEEAELKEDPVLKDLITPA